MGKSNVRAASPMPRMQPTSWPMISGRSGLPKLRLSVSADGGEITPGFRHRLLAAFERIGLAIARRDVRGQRQRLRTVVDAYHGGVPARALHCVADDDVVVLFPNPAPRTQVRRAEQSLQRVRARHRRDDVRRLDDFL